MPRHAIKVLWQETTPVPAASSHHDLNGNGSSALTSSALRKEEIDWPLCLEEVLCRLLRERSGMLPVPSDGPFKGWETAVLDRCGW